MVATTGRKAGSIQATGATASTPTLLNEAHAVPGPRGRSRKSTPQQIIDAAQRASMLFSEMDLTLAVGFVGVAYEIQFAETAAARNKVAGFDKFKPANPLAMKPSYEQVALIQLNLALKALETRGLAGLDQLQKRVNFFAASIAKAREMGPISTATLSKLKDVAQSVAGETSLIQLVIDQAPRDQVCVLGVLLDAGLSPDFRAKAGGPSPLLSAIRHGDAEVVKLLVRRGANPYVRADELFDNSQAVRPAQKVDQFMHAFQARQELINSNRPSAVPQM